MSNNGVTLSKGPGVLDTLTIAFIVLKLAGKIAWSWWWVLSPTLIPLGLALVILFAIALAQALA